ncbi:MAG: DUF4911 domain-containing protein [Polyangiaceae bacterium]
MPRRPVPPLTGPGLVTRRLVVPSREVVFVKGIVEAHEGLAQVFAEKGGDLTFAAPADRERELDELVADLAAEIGGLVPTS